MKRTTKSLLITASILFATGLILALSSALFVKINGIDAYGVVQKPSLIEENKNYTVSDILAQSPDANFNQGTAETHFTEVDIISYAGNVVVRPTEGETYVHLEHANTSNLSVQIVGDKLTVREVDPVGFFGIYIDQDGFSFKGLRQLFGPGNSANSGKTITLYLGADSTVEKVSVDSKIGDVTVDAVSVAQINVKNYSGKVSLLNLQNKESKLTVSANSGSVLLKNNLYANCNVSVQFGNITAHLSEIQSNSTVLDAWAGDVFVESRLPLDQYKVGASTSFGSVTGDGTVHGKAWNSDSSTTFRITSTVILGNVVITTHPDAEDILASLPPATEEVPTEETVTAEE